MSNTKRHLISAGVTFVGSFLLFVLPVITDPTWSYTGKVALVALLLSGVRAGVKALWEKFGPELAS
jgi:hypothetical protein